VILGPADNPPFPQSLSLSVEGNETRNTERGCFVPRFP
jgi:hypothetical protein